MFLMKKTENTSSLAGNLCFYKKSDIRKVLKSVKASPFYTTAVSKLTFPWSRFLMFLKMSLWNSPPTLETCGTDQTGKKRSNT